MLDSLAHGARSLLQLELTPTQLAAFQTYADELRAWNEKFNITAIKDSEGIQIKHFLDSLSILKVFNFGLRTSDSAKRPFGVGLRPSSSRSGLYAKRSSFIDIGTGAGFPGLPLKIVCPDIQLTLVEATGKKVKFCEHMISKLNLHGVTVVKARAEEIGHDPAHREHYDWAIARAVAEMSTLAEYLLPLVKRGGRAIAQKGSGAPMETQTAAGAVKRLGGELEHIVPVELPGIAETRYLVVFKKIAATPAAYPRRTGIPTKAPLA